MASFHLMAKFKLLIYLLLACGVANAGVTLSLHGAKYEHEYKTRWMVGDADLVIKSLPDGWDKCVAHTRGSSSNLNYGEVACHTIGGGITTINCLAKNGQTEDSSRMNLTSSADFDVKFFGTAKVSRWVMIKCTYP